MHCAKESKRDKKKDLGKRIKGENKGREGRKRKATNEGMRVVAQEVRDQVCPVSSETFVNNSIHATESGGRYFLGRGTRDRPVKR